MLIYFLCYISIWNSYLYIVILLLLIYAYICIYVCVCTFVHINKYIIFILCLCLLFIVLRISHLILFMLRHISLRLFRKCIWSHANIWDAASFWNSLQSLAIDCIYRELHLGCLHWFCMRFWLFCFKRSHWFVNAVVEGLIQQQQIVDVWFVFLLFYW